MIDLDLLYERRLIEQQNRVSGNPDAAVQHIASQIPKAPQSGGYTVCMDFDGVLNHHEVGDPVEKIGAPLTPGIQLAKRIKQAGHRLVILTARPEQMHDTIDGWLRGQGVRADEVTNVKPPAALYIDDRAEKWPQNYAGQQREAMRRIDAFTEAGVKGQKWGVHHPKQKSKAARAKSSYVMVTAEKYQRAMKSEEMVAKAVKGNSIPDNAPFDVQTKRVLLEIKTIDAGKNDKITMHKDSLARKVAAAKKMGMEAHTVVVDIRSGKPEIYYREGLGSFRLGKMEKLKNLNELKKRIES